MNIEKTISAAALTGLLCIGSLLSAAAQLSISFNNAPSDTRTVLPGSTTTFKATISNSSTNALELIGIGVNFDEFGDISWGDFTPTSSLFETNFMTPSQYLLGSGTRTADMFRADLISNPSQPVPHNYTGTVNVFYKVVGGDGSTLMASKGFTVQSTPSPPVILVTLVGGIGAARMALRRRKSSSS
jgi:hypothetical protein